MRNHYVPAAQRANADQQYRSDIERAAWRQSLADRMLVTAVAELQRNAWGNR